MTDNAKLPKEQLLADVIQNVAKLIGDLEAFLNQQKKALREQGVAMPINLVLGLQHLQTNVDALTKATDEREVELQRLRALSRTAELVYSSLDLDLVLNEVIDTVVQLTKAERGYLMLINPETNELEFRVARNFEQRSMTEDESIVSRSIIARVVKDAEPIVTTNAAEDTRFAGQQSIVGLVLRSILCVPLIRKGQVIGVIYADNRLRLGLFTDQELKLLQAFAGQAAIAIENARLFGHVKADLEKAQREVQELRIQIDEKRLQKEVGQITDSGFFQELQAKLRTIRGDTTTPGGDQQT
jgi:adenylate cyclase